MEKSYTFLEIKYCLVVVVPVVFFNFQQKLFTLRSLPRIKWARKKVCIHSLMTVKTVTIHL